jgi:perosamine synthetase
MQISQIYPWINNKELTYLKKVIESTFITENKFTKQFENKFKKFVGAKYAIAVNNWTLGMFACLKSLNIGPGDEVIVPNITFIATANAVLLSGAKVVLCEVKYETLCLDIDHLEKLINSKTKAIIPVHLYGNSCEMDKIKNLKRKKNFYVIEDAAQGLGVKYKNQHVGTIGEVGGFSFYGNKILTTGEGGMVVTNNKKIYDFIKSFKNYGRKGKGVYVHEKIGFNFKFTELQAAVGLAQFDKLKKSLDKKQKIFNFYKKNLENISEISFVKPSKKSNQVHWFSNIFCTNIKLLNFLKEKGIEVRKTFYPLHLQPCYKNNKNIIIKGNYNNSNKIYRNLLSLPSAVQIKHSELKKVAKNINLFFKKDA